MMLHLVLHPQANICRDPVLSRFRKAFPLKLFEILSNEPADLIQWSDDGKSFVVNDGNRFASEVLTKH